MTIKHIKDAITKWQIDGDLDAAVIRIPDTGAAVTSVVLPNKIGRVLVGCQIIKKNKDCDVFIISATADKIVVQFTAAHADINLRIW